MSNQKLWGGRFTQPTSQLVEEFTASIHYDARLYRHDIQASIVHCQMLARQEIITHGEAETIVAGLNHVLNELDEGTLPFDPALEDIHMHVESRLRELIGPVAGKLHTARSRNDQVATDLRLYLREVSDTALELLRELQRALVTLAAAEVETIMPGFTHLQPAQPVSLGHHLLAYCEMLERDHQRFAQTRERINHLPLGAAALAGTPYPVDREWVAAQLGCAAVCRNSMDAVSDRDFAIEFAANSALLLLHLSRFAEELVLWTAPAFGFVKLADQFCTGSSIMPQKKNPDVAELVRAKTGRVNGNLVALLTLMKGLPLTYNRDLQEVKEQIFDSVDTVLAVLRVMVAMVPGITPQREKLAAVAGTGFTTATDLADFLVRRGVPFREAHGIVGELVHRCEASDRILEELTPEELHAVDPRLDAAAQAVLAVTASVNARAGIGGTAFSRVREQVAEWRRRLG